MDYKTIAHADPAAARCIEGERRREKEGLELIASENYVSTAVQEALGSIFTNKYSEGYPGKRYYGGQEFMDEAEQLAIDRAKKLFKCDHANVQPLSGAPANISVYSAWCEPGDTILGMDLTHGGHLTHGAPVTLAAKIYRFLRYKMKDVETGEIDYGALAEIAKKEKPKIILAGFSAYPREIDYAKIAEIANAVGAVAMMDMAHIAGLIAGGAAKNPFDYGFHVVTTTTHKTLRGPRGGMILSNGVVSNPLKAPERTIKNLPTLIDRAVFPGLQGGPHMNNVLAKAVCFGEALKPEFKKYAKQIVANAKILADELMAHSAKLVTNGTDNHMMVVDCVRSWDTDGKTMQELLDRIGLSASKSTVPDDANPPYKPSGLRIGTPAATTRGMKEREMKKIARWIMAAFVARADEAKLEAIHREVRILCRKFPIPSR